MVSETQGWQVVDDGAVPVKLAPKCCAHRVKPATSRHFGPISTMIAGSQATSELRSRCCQVASDLSRVERSRVEERGAEVDPFRSVFQHGGCGPRGLIVDHSGGIWGWFGAPYAPYQVLTAPFAAVCRSLDGAKDKNNHGPYCLEGKLGTMMRTRPYAPSVSVNEASFYSLVRLSRYSDGQCPWVASKSNR